LRILEKDEGLVKVVRQLVFPAIPARSGRSRKAVAEGAQTSFSFAFGSLPLSERPL